jgi:hypothetical protein
VLGLVTNSISIAELATLITAAGLGIYALGLVGVALSIQIVFTSSWSAAWYAASLMPRVVVAGQGMRLWWRGMANAVLVMFSAIIYGVFWREFFSGPMRLLDLIGKGIGIVIWTIMIALLIGLYAYQTRLSPRTAMTMGLFGLFITLIATLVVWRALNIDFDLLYTWAGLWTIVSNWDSMVSDWDSVAAGGLLLLLGVFILGVPLAGAVEHPLPRVRINIKPEEQPSTEGQPSTEEQSSTQTAGVEALEGWLVAHTDSSWHLFDSSNSLVSIPDDRVTEAQVHEEDTEGDPPGATS